MGYIYVINHNFKPVYVGQTIKTIEERWKEHLGTARRQKNMFAIHKAINKYGAKNFSITLLEETKDLDAREKYWIKKLKTHISENGYNMTWGGQNSADSQKRQCYQFSLKGDLICSHESVNAAARSVNGSHENLLKVLTGELNTAYGYRWSYNKTIPPLKSNHTGAAKPVHQFDLNGKYLKTFASTKEAARALNKSQGNISSAANGKRKTAYGFIWSYSMNLAGY